MNSEAGKTVLSNKYLLPSLKEKLLLNSISLEGSEVPAAPWNLCAGEHEADKSSPYQSCRSFSGIKWKTCSEFCHAASCSFLTGRLSYTIGTLPKPTVYEAVTYKNIH